jgi:hypothetical protein
MTRYITLIAVFTLPILGAAQKSVRIEKEIRRLEQRIVDGVLSGDTNSLKQLWAPEFTVNTPRNDIAINRAAVIDLQKNRLLDYSKYERNIENVLVQKNLVVTMGNEMFVSRIDLPGSKAGEPVKRRFTNIWVYKKGKWQQVARHASMICSQ